MTSLRKRPPMLPRPPRSLTRSCILGVLLVAASCDDDTGDGDAGGTSVGSTAGTAGATDSSDEDTGTAASSAGGSGVDDAHGMPCHCEGDELNFCSPDLSECPDDLSCVFGNCRTWCEGPDDTSCGPGVRCIGLGLDGEDLGFFCSI